MTARSRQTFKLAYALGQHFGVRVDITYDGPRSRDGRSGGWIVQWVDGPAVDTMRAEIQHRAAAYPAIDLAQLRYSRGYSDHAEAAALLAWLPQHPDYLPHVDSTFLASRAHAATDFPERLDETVQRRARALLNLGHGNLSLAVIQELGQHCWRGWDHVTTWLDELAAVADENAGDNVIDLTSRRRSRSH
ncbi:hypothetical protein [Prauserella muralis]|uniref:Uncharacterized protein n=1 Tax=Prauserella muralis TaxID=588067 RepID=A0A2V4ABY3_9PSEU|nr:hypothetical protein [Prauserella muralis]PXY16622.1 hypothetical protein BAY60_36135 [Prauserella muralis]TWE11128.1 hypothetical protein FHX69_7347 [Prauserella muralis]